MPRRQGGTSTPDGGTTGAAGGRADAHGPADDGQRPERMLGTVRRLGQVLDLFGPEHPEWQLADVARALGVGRSTAHLLLASMARIGLLRRTAAGHYALGWSLLGLAQVVADSTGFRAAAMPVMRQLVARYGETVHLATLEDGQCVYVAKIEGTRAIRIAVSYTGARLPPHGSGCGKVLLAHRPWSDVERLLAAGGLPAHTPRTITDPEAFRAALAEVRRAGFACDWEETVPEVACVAAPIRDHTASVVAAISLSVPAYRLRAQFDQYNRAIVSAARRISADLGHRAAAPARAGRRREPATPSPRPQAGP